MLIRSPRTRLERRTLRHALSAAEDAVTARLDEEHARSVLAARGLAWDGRAQAAFTELMARHRPVGHPRRTTASLAGPDIVGLADTYADRAERDGLSDPSDNDSDGDDVNDPCGE